MAITPREDKGGPAGGAPSGSAPESARELLMVRLRFKEGRLRDAESDRPIPLSDPNKVRLVYNGKVDLFAVPMQEGEPAGPRRFLCRLEVGDALFGAPPRELSPNVSLTLLAVGHVGTRVIEVPRDRLARLAGETEFADEIARILETWVNALSDRMGRDALPTQCTLLSGTEGESSLAAGVSARPERGLLWMEPKAPASLTWTDTSLTVEPGSLFPLSHRAWVTPDQPVEIRSYRTKTAVTQGEVWEGLDRFHATFVECLTRRVERSDAEAHTQVRRAQETDERVMQRALQRLAGVLDPGSAAIPHPQDSPDALFTACQMVAGKLGLTLTRALRSQPAQSPEHAVRSIAQASRVRVRPVKLEGDWWQRENGPLLVFQTSPGETNASPEGSPLPPRRPMALIPSARSYQLIDPETGAQTRLDAAGAEQIAEQAFQFYPALPARPLNGWDLARCALQGSRREMGIVALAGAFVGLLALLPPILTGQVINSVIPNAEKTKLPLMVLGLGMAAFSSALFLVINAVAVLRIETRADTGLQAAIWDRLLSLPVSFFRQFTAGELASRAMSVAAMRQALGGTAVASLLSALFSFFSAALLFHYDAELALRGLAATAGMAVIAFIFALVQLKHQRRLAAVQRRIAGTVLQLLTGIAKLRVAGAETRAFGLWTRAFVQQREVTFQTRSAANFLAVFNAIWPVIPTLIFFSAVAAPSHTPLSSGDFLAFLTAFAQFQAGVVSLIATTSAALSVIPLMEQIAPILQALPEVNVDRADPGVLRGAIAMNHVYFRYAPDGPPILQDVTLHAEPGEFIAIVGPSGAGKSSLLRLLLGLGAPESGSVFFDNQDLANLDIQAVRHQMGVVPQDARLMPGSLLNNIIGDAQLTIDDAWDAAQLAGIADDIKRMPMGMYTVVSEGSSTFSGGQRQRLMIARAVARKPCILLFDEATSALDNQTQAIVTRGLEQLQATRIVIAHRLSTIQRADRIYVLESGRVAQVGRYDELIKQPGPFAEMAKRQLA